MKKLIGFLVVLFVLGMAGCQPSPEAIVQAWGDALNAGDMEKALSYISDDVTIQLIPPAVEGDDGIYSGKEELRAWYEALVALHCQGTLTNIQVNGDQVTALLTYADDSLKAIGLDAIDNEWVATIRDGKIQRYTATMTDKSMADLMTAMTHATLIGTWQWTGAPTVLIKHNPDGTYAMHAAPWPHETGQTPLEALEKNPADSGTYEVVGNQVTTTSGEATIVCEPGDVAIGNVTILDENTFFSTDISEDCGFRKSPLRENTFIRLEP